MLIYKHRANINYKEKMLDIIVLRNKHEAHYSKKPAGLQIFSKIGGPKRHMEQKYGGSFSEMMGPSISN